MIDVVRAYEADSAGAGRRFLVDRMWPRGIRKEALRVEKRRYNNAVALKEYLGGKLQQQQ